MDTKKNPEGSSAGRALRKAALTIVFAVVAMVGFFLIFFVFLPVPVTYHLTERYSFAAREHDAPVRLAVILPKTGPYQKVTDVRISWEGTCVTNRHPELDVLQLVGSVRARQTNVAVIQYTARMWQGRARWNGEVKESQRRPEPGIESANPALAERARQLASGQSREDAYRLFKFAASHLSWPRGSRINAAISAAAAYEGRVGGCGEFANLTVGLMRARGIPARAVSGLFLAPQPPLWSSTKTWNHPAGAHAWIEFYADGQWEMADPSYASFFPWKGIAFGRNDGGHLSYGDAGEHDRVFKDVCSWAAEGGRVLCAMSAPLKFAASAGADGVSVVPQAQVRWGFWDWRWLGILLVVILSLVRAWRVQRRAQ